MIGRVEVTEILGMAATCAVLLFAGFSVEVLDANVEPSWATSVEIRAPEVPGLPDEIRLELPEFERPVHPAPPVVSLDDLEEPFALPRRCDCSPVIVRPGDMTDRLSGSV